MMTLVQEIIDGAVSDEKSIMTLLRKCLVLSARIDNPLLKEWAKNELDGYNDKEALPEYRVINTHAQGHFQGGFGAAIRNATLPPICLKPELRHWASTAYLTEPIASYEIAAKNGIKDNFKITWPQDLVVLTQSDFYQHYALASAWLVIPAGAMIAICDTVRNRVLSFALELQDAGGNDEGIKELSQEKVTSYVTNFIYGNHNVLAGQARDIINSGNSNVTKGDLEGFAMALESIGIGERAVEEFKSALNQDANYDTNAPGPASTGWLGKTMISAGKGSAKVGAAVAQATLTAAFMGYFGLGS